MCSGFLTCSRPLWLQERLHCSRGEAWLTGVQETDWMGGEGGSKTKPRQRPATRPFLGVSAAPLDTSEMNGSVNTLLSAPRGDPEGPSERRQHSPAAERSHGAALRQPHCRRHGDHLGRGRHLPALPLPPRDAFGRRRNQARIRAQLGALDSLQITG